MTIPVVAVNVLADPRSGKPGRPRKLEVGSRQAVRACYSIHDRQEVLGPDHFVVSLSPPTCPLPSRTVSPLLCHRLRTEVEETHSCLEGGQPWEQSSKLNPNAV